MTLSIFQPWTFFPAAMSLALLVHLGGVLVRAAWTPHCLLYVSSDPPAYRWVGLNARNNLRP